MTKHVLTYKLTEEVTIIDRLETLSHKGRKRLAELALHGNIDRYEGECDRAKSSMADISSLMADLLEEEVDTDDYESEETIIKGLRDGDIQVLVYAPDMPDQYPFEFHKEKKI